MAVWVWAARAQAQTPAAVDAFAPVINGTVWSLAVQRDGKVLVGGDFTRVNGLARGYLVRLTAAGALDASFSATANSPSVLVLAEQADERIVVAGGFTGLGGQPRNRIGRLSREGVLDAGFNPNANDTVRAVLAQADGILWVAGDFTAVGGQTRSRLARLNAEGALSAAADPGADGPVCCLALQGDGKILVGGSFTSLGGQPRSRIGRLNADGSLDAGFNPEADGVVLCLAVQADGRILAGGSFGRLAGQGRACLGRLEPDGSLDAGFNPGADGAFVSSLVLEAGGKILAGGSFTVLAGQARGRLGRLNPDGSLDTSWAADADETVYALGIQADGTVLAGGSFGLIGGQPRSRLARIPNTRPAVQSWVLEGESLLWLRGEACPEISRATLEASPDGAAWTTLAAGGRFDRGWHFSGLEMPPNTSLRTRGYVSGGAGNASGWFVEAGTGAPVILRQPQSQRVGAGSNVVFSVWVAGGPPLSCQWRRDGRPLGGALLPSVTVSNVQWSDDGSHYWLEASNAMGVVTSRVALLTVAEPSGLLTRGPCIMMGHFTNQSTVVWRTAVPTESWIQYGLTRAYGLMAGSPDPVLQHEVTLAGLEPGQTYYYQLMNGAAPLISAKFRSGKGPGAPMRVAWTGDHQGGGGGFLADIIKTCQPDLVLHMGDIAETCAPASLDAEFFSVFEPVLRESPSYWTPGNHEGDGCSAALEAFDLLPEDHQSYSIEYGDLQVIAINSPAPPPADWLRARLAASGRPWRVVFSHYPMRSADGGGGERDGGVLRASHLPLLEQYGVNVVVAGHNHYYWRSLPLEGIHFFVAGSGGAERYALGDLPSYTAAANDTVDAFVYADIDGPFLHMHTLDAAGVQIDEALIDRECAFQLDGLLDPSAVLLGSRPGGLPLYAAVSGRYLYAATAPATASDHFVVLSRTPSQTQQSLGPVWQKSGTAMAFDAFLASKGADNTNGWFNAGGECLNNLRTARSATRYDKSGWLEGVIDLEALYGQIPSTLYLAAAAFEPGAGGSMMPSQQFPAGNGDGTLGSEEFLAVTTSAITRAMPSLGRLVLSRSGSGDGASLDLAGPACTAYDLEVSRDLVRWDPVARGITSDTGQLQLSDPAVAANETRFYRARQVAP